MKFKSNKAIAAAVVATIVVSIALGACQGRKMSNMEPTGETVEVVIGDADTTSADTATTPTDSADTL